MLTYGYGPLAGGYGRFGGANIQQNFEQETIGYGPQGYVIVVFLLSDKSIFLLLQIRNLRTGYTDQSKSLHWSNDYRTRK